VGVGGTSSGPGVRSGSSGDDYRTAGKMRGTRTRARRGRAQIATINSESQAISSHPQPHAHGTAMGTARAPSWGPAPKRCKKRMCFLVNRPPAAGEKFSGSIVIVKPPGPIRIGRGRRPMRRPDECGLLSAGGSGGSGGAGGIAYLQQCGACQGACQGGRGRAVRRG
jgi:hypothetical protein